MNPAAAPADARERLTQAVFRAVEQVNRARPPQRRLVRSLTSVLIGSESVVDSLGLVNLIVAVEEQIEDEFGIAITLADERARARAENPLATLGSLVRYLEELMAERVHG